MKQIIAVDLNGALMRSRPFEEAHKKWFNVMSFLLGDESIKTYSELENYFGKVNEVMQQYLGDIDETSRTKFARNLFSFLLIAEATSKDGITDFADYLRSIKTKYKIALITSAPEDAVEPLLQKIKCADIFDRVIKSPAKEQPNKKKLFETFTKKHDKPLLYIGNGDKDITSCKELGITTISVNWVSRGKIKGDYDIDAVEELKKIIK